ncbi:MAG TPA: Rnf-Nqr domain containing protein [Povalibacter sp.]|nr:Rnf-Nqr domain containing protein [Povalibacter sp.]
MNRQTVAIERQNRQVLLVLALCPALAVSDTTANALGLGAAALLASVVTCMAASFLRRLPAQAQWPIGILVFAAIVSATSLWLDAWLHELHRALGIFLPLLVANVAIQLRARESASVALAEAAMLGVRTGGAMAMVLLVLALARELVGRGSILHDAGRLLGNAAGMIDVQLFRADMGFLLAMLPPGAFISLGLLLAARNWLETRHLHEQEQDR